MTPRCRFGKCPAYALAQVKVNGGLAVRLCGPHLVTVLTDATFDATGVRFAHPPEVRLVLLGTEEP